LVIWRGHATGEKRPAKAEVLILLEHVREDQMEIRK